MWRSTLCWISWPFPISASITPRLHLRGGQPAVAQAARRQDQEPLLRDPKSERLFLVVTPEESRVDLKGLAAALGVKRLSFGSPERLESVLGLTRVRSPCSPWCATGKSGGTGGG